MTALTGGKARLKTLLSQMVRWRVGLRWYAAALGLPVGVYLVALSLNVLLALARSQRSSSGWYLAFPLFAFSLLFPLSGAF